MEEGKFVGLEVQDEQPVAPSARGLQLPTQPSIFLFVGKPRSGKSHAIKSILYRYAKAKFFRFGYVFCATKYNHDYDYLPSKIVDDKYSDKRLDKYIQRLRDIRNEKGQIPPNFLILDDLLGRIEFYSKEITHFLATFRHTNTYVFISSQYLGSRGSSTALREYANYVFMWRCNTANAVELLYQGFGRFAKSDQRGLFNSVEEFHAMLTKATDPRVCRYRCLLLVNEIDSSPYFSFFLADQVPAFRISL